MAKKRFFTDMERIARENSSKHLLVVEHYYGIELLLYREHEDKHADVYGKYSGSKGSFHKKFIGILANDDFFATDMGHAGNFEEGFMYTSESDVRVSDTIVVESIDGRQRRHKVGSKESLGTENAVFFRYRLTNLGD